MHSINSVVITVYALFWIARHKLILFTENDNLYVKYLICHNRPRAATSDFSFSEIKQWEGKIFFVIGHESITRVKFSTAMLVKITRLWIYPWEIFKSRTWKCSYFRCINDSLRALTGMWEELMALELSTQSHLCPAHKRCSAQNKWLKFVTS